MGSPTSIGGLSIDRVGKLNKRVHRILLGGLDSRKKRMNPGLKVMRTAVTLRCIFSSPASGVICSISRRDCARGVLANHQTTFVGTSRCSRISKCSRPSRDRRSFFIVKRASASIDLTDKLTGTHSLGKRTNGIVTIVNSNSLDKNRTFRKLGMNTRLNAGFVIVIGSGRVSVTRGRNKLCHGLRRLHRARKRTPYGCFGTVKCSCLCIGSNGSIRRLVRTFHRIGSGGRPIIMRVGALGNGKCGLTRRRGRHFRCDIPFSLRANGLANRSKRNRSCTSLATNCLLRRVGGSPAIINVATNAPAMFNFAPRHHGRTKQRFVSVNVTRRRTITVTSTVTTKNKGPMFKICDAFVRHTCSRLSRSLYVGGGPTLVLIF